MGRLSATSGDPVPTQERLESAASKISLNSTSIRDKSQFDRGFASGFAVGFKEVRKPAF